MREPTAICESVVWRGCNAAGVHACALVDCVVPGVLVPVVVWLEVMVVLCDVDCVVVRLDVGVGVAGYAVMRDCLTLYIMNDKMRCPRQAAK